MDNPVLIKIINAKDTENHFDQLFKFAIFFLFKKQDDVFRMIIK